MAAQLQIFAGLLVVALYEFRLVLRVEFGVEVGQAQVGQHRFHRCPAGDPSVADFMAIADAHQVETQHFTATRFVSDANAFFTVRMFPVNGGLFIGQFCPDVAVSLVFDIEKLG